MPINLVILVIVKDMQIGINRIGINQNNQHPAAITCMVMMINVDTVTMVTIRTEWVVAVDGGGIPATSHHQSMNAAAG
jgi:hypothetical protein